MIELDFGSVLTVSVSDHPELSTVEGLASAIPPGTTTLALEHLDEVLPPDQRNEEGLYSFMERLIERSGNPNLVLLAILSGESVGIVREHR